jgi:hypothetical protein
MTKEQLPGESTVKDVPSKMQQGPGQVPSSTQQDPRAAKQPEGIKPQQPGEADKNVGIDRSGRK